jgi:predicted PhzF superfamily epimerase YddE/YHI9
VIVGRRAAFAAGVVAPRKAQRRNAWFAIEQGCEMGRPSPTEFSTSIARGMLVAADIAGEAVRIAEGTIEA